MSATEWPIACVICQACDAPAVKAARYGRGQDARAVVLCGWHANELGKHRSFAAAYRARAATTLAHNRVVTPRTHREPTGSENVSESILGAK